MSHYIPLSYNPLDSDALKTVIDSFEGRLHTEIVSEFEKKISGITGSRFVVAVQSGTAALHLALRALQVSTGDNVITSTFTYVGSVNPIRYRDANPIFIDCEDDTWNMDPNLVEKAIVESTRKPKAILPVHSYGMPADMDALLAISKKYQIPILEDAAEGIGAFHKGRHLGTLGDVGVLSFNSNKIITTYGGGAVLTNDEDIYRKVKYWASQAREEQSYYLHLEVGYNYRLGPLNAAAGLAALKSFDERIEASRNKFLKYKQELTGEDFQFIHEPQGYRSNHWLSTVFVKKKGISALSLQAELQKEGIETRLFWNPMHRQPVFSHFKAFLNGTADTLFAGGLCLPSSFSLTDEEQNRVTALLRRLIA